LQSTLVMQTRLRHNESAEKPHLSLLYGIIILKKLTAA